MLVTTMIGLRMTDDFDRDAGARGLPAAALTEGLDPVRFRVETRPTPAGDAG